MPGKTIKVNDVEYKLDDLNVEAKAQLDAIVFTDAYIKNLKNRVSMAETAKIAYLKAFTRIVEDNK